MRKVRTDKLVESQFMDANPTTKLESIETEYSTEMLHTQIMSKTRLAN